ncbi:MAG TPA: hypothetical protein VHA30_04170 [Patescibacteria group bacterium]|nr:hypothetical protein [Patescibacteria group bacterium]
MAYVIKQKLQLSDLVDLAEAPRKILLHVPEEALGELYAYHLRPHGFMVGSCADFLQLEKFLGLFLPDLLVLDLGEAGRAEEKIIWLRRAKRLWPDLRIVSLSRADDGDLVRRAMAVGVSGHLSRRFSRPQDLAVLVRTLLHN